MNKKKDPELRSKLMRMQQDLEDYYSKIMGILESRNEEEVLKINLPNGLVKCLYTFSRDAFMVLGDMTYYEDKLKLKLK